MTWEQKTVIAIDLGASSGRLIGVTLQDGKLDMKEIYRFPNEGIHAGAEILYRCAAYFS